VFGLQHLRLLLNTWSSLVVVVAAITSVVVVALVVLELLQVLP